MVYLLLFILSALLTLGVREVAKKRELLSHANHRSSHTVPTPHGGGVAIALTWFAGISWLFWQGQIPGELYYALLGGVLLAAVSLADDIYELSPKIRLGAQALTALIGLASIGGVEAINLYYFSLTQPVLTNTVAFLMVMWFINLYNFQDGIDGYAASEAIFLALAAFIIFDAPVFLVLMVSVAGFLLFNWQRASIFMGDVGSTLLGYNVAIFALYYKSEGASLMVWLILFGLFWFDATLTLYRRYKNGEKLTQAHRKHAYQRLVQAGWSHQKVVLYGLGLNCALLLIAIYVAHPLVGLFAAMALLYGAVRFIDSKKAFE